MLLCYFRVDWDGESEKHSNKLRTDHRWLQTDKRWKQRIDKKIESSDQVMFWDHLLSKSCDEYPSKGGCTSRALLRCGDDLSVTIY